MGDREVCETLSGFSGPRGTLFKIRSVCHTFTLRYKLQNTSSIKRTAGGIQSTRVASIRKTEQP